MFDVEKKVTVVECNISQPIPKEKTLYQKVRGWIKKLVNIDTYFNS